MDMGANILYLIMLLVLVGGALFTRGRFGQNIQYLLIWAGIILILVLGYRWYERLQSAPNLESDGTYSLTIPYDQRQGGYHIIFQSNGAEIDGIVDTGATQVVLTNDDAKKSGLDTSSLDYSVEVSTANGSTYTAHATLESLGFGDQIFTDVHVLVARENDLEKSLIGRSLLRRFESFTANGDYLRIKF